MQIRAKDRKQLAAHLRNAKGELGATVAAVGQVINGQSKSMSAENAARAARYLGVDCFWLSTGEGEPGAHVPSGADLKVLDGLHTIEQFDPETHGKLMVDIEKMAEGMITTHMVLSGHGVTSYVSPKRAAEKLRPAASTKAPEPRKAKR